MQMKIQMTRKPACVFALLLLALGNPAFADSNLAGVEIVAHNDYDLSADAMIDTSTDLTSAEQEDPIMEYLTRDRSTEADTYSSNLESDQAAADLWQRIKDGYAMPEIDSQYTKNHEAWYAARPDYVRRMVERSQKYLYHVVEEVEKRGMPTEIALLPMVESAFNPQAYSRSHASGIWQFIPSTGKLYGLKQNWWSDNRRDITEATNAALTYLQKLHVMFGTWDLALAAYNAGEGTVKRAIERNKKLGLPTDYQNLSLPPETRNYVPKLQAVKNIMTHPEKYGLDVKAIPNQPYFAKVTAPQQIDAKLAAKLAEIPYDEFSSLNPEYNRPVLTANGNVHELLLPVSAVETFKTNLANYDKPLVSWQTYYAKRGERMDNIARKFGISVAQLRNINDLPARNKLRSAVPIMVPKGKLVTDYKIDRGESQLNNSPSSEETPVAEQPAPDISEDTPTEQPVPTGASVRHKVKKGETVFSIAQRYRLNPKELAAENHLRNNRVNVGQTLTIRNAAEKTLTAAKEPAKHTAKMASSKKTRYVVKRGDTLDSIARKFDVARADLQRWNNIKGSHITPGLKLTVILDNEA